MFVCISLPTFWLDLWLCSSIISTTSVQKEKKRIKNLDPFLPSAALQMKSCSDWTKKIRTRSWLQIMRTCEQSGHLNAPSVFVWRGLLKTNPKTLSSNSANRLQSQQILKRMLNSFLLSTESKHQLNFKDMFHFI